MPIEENILCVLPVLSKMTKIEQLLKMIMKICTCITIAEIKTILHFSSLYILHQSK